MSPKVSIITPNRNKARYIAETLDSVLRQTHESWELLFVDDASTDDSIEIARAYAARDERIQLHCNERRLGGSASRNVGIDRSTGEAILFLDSDDLLGPRCLEDRLRQLHSARLDFVVAPMGTFRRSLGDSRSVWRPSRRGALRGFLSHRLPWSIMSPLYTAGFVARVGPFDEAFPRLQDVDFHTRCLLEPSCSFAILPVKQADCFYRIARDRTELPSEEQVRDFVTAIRLYVEKFFPLLQESGRCPTDYLLVSLFRGCEAVCRAMHSGELARQRGEALLDELFETAVYRGAGRGKRRLLRTYSQSFGESRGWRLPGVGFTLRFLLRA